MKIVIFGGTTEGRELSRLLAEAGASGTVCVATEYGGEEQGSVLGAEIRVGPVSAEEKQRLLHDADLCVDATHPYARHVTASVKAACEAAGTEYLRLLRPASETGDTLSFDSAAETAAAPAVSRKRRRPRLRPGRSFFSCAARRKRASALTRY